MKDKEQLRRLQLIFNECYYWYKEPYQGWNNWSGK
jgi:hypothetical protein